MQAWIIERFGLENLRLQERPAPAPGPHQILVRVRAASLNFRDRMIVDGHYDPHAKLPLVPGSDGAGEVVALGDGVTRFRVGDRVVGAYEQHWTSGPALGAPLNATLGHPRDGVLAEYVVLDESGAVRIPDAMSFEDASTLPVAAVTAWRALFGELPIGPAHTVVTQGTGGVSVFAIQLAHAAGARVIATSSSPDKLARARQLGADDVIDYRATPDWDTRVRELTGGVGADLVIDVAGGDLSRSLAATRSGGQISLVGLLAGAGATLPLIPVLARAIRLQGIHVGNRADLESVVAAIARHGIAPAIDRVVPFARAKEALAAMAGGGSYVGKLVVRGVE